MTTWMSRVAGAVLGRQPWLAAIAASASAGLVHLAHGPAHLEELGALGAGFHLAAGLQLGWAALAVAVLATSRMGSLRGTAVLIMSGIAINGAILAAWATSRIVGLPAGEAPWTPEPIATADAISAALQGFLVVGLTAALRGWSVPRLPGLQRFATAGAAMAILLIATGTAVAISPSQPSHTHPLGYEHPGTDAHAESVEPALSGQDGGDRAEGDTHAGGDEHADSRHDGQPAGG